MVRKRLWLNGCIACRSDAEIQVIMENGRKWSPRFRHEEAPDNSRVVVWGVLCWWCRQQHSPAEVETCMALPERRADANGSTSSTSSALVAGPLKPLPELWAFLTATSYPDGRKRRTGRLSVSFESGMLGLLLTDDETGQYAFLNGRNLDDLLAEAELRLGDGSLSFKVSKYNRRKS